MLGVLNCTRRVFIFACLLSGALSLPLHAIVPPGSNFDLSHWKLGVPVDANGGMSGTAAEIKTPDLVDGYSSQWFYTDPDGAMAFWAPVIGATTSGSTYPRSELREVLDPDDSTVNWSANGMHIMSARCKVTQLPSEGKLIIGQVHGYNFPPVVKLQLNHGDVEAVVLSNIAADTAVRFNFPNLSLNDIIDYQIQIANGVAWITVNGVTYSHNFFASDPVWKTVSFYFKAGSYLQDNVGTASEGGRVSFYQLSAIHPGAGPNIFVQPVSQTVPRGGSVNLFVTASGPPPVTYQWRANGIPMPGRNSDSIFLSNFQEGDERRYEVVVTAAGSSVTSAVARLHLNAPARFTNIGMTNGRFRAQLLGAANTTYIVQGSTDNVTWSNLATNTSLTGIITVTDVSPPGRNRYYRAR